MFKSLEIKQRVAAGVKFLDEHAPYWAHYARPQYLHMSHPQLCMVAQVYHGWEKRPDALRVDGITVAYGFFTKSKHQFMRDIEWWLLGREWKEQIKERLASMEGVTV